MKLQPLLTFSSSDQFSRKSRFNQKNNDSSYDKQSLQLHFGEFFFFVSVSQENYFWQKNRIGAGFLVDCESISWPTNAAIFKGTMTSSLGVIFMMNIPKMKLFSNLGYICHIQKQEKCTLIISHLFNVYSSFQHIPKVTIKITQSLSFTKLIE